jgi:hypothetical protein
VGELTLPNHERNQSAKQAKITAGIAGRNLAPATPAVTESSGFGTGQFLRVSGRLC